jgi:hypothetical protein
MELTKRSNPTGIKISLTLISMLLLCFSAVAQTPDMIDDGTEQVRRGYFGDEPRDLEIPSNTNYNKIRFKLKGARGGYAHTVVGTCVGEGGDGASVQIDVRLGSQPGQIPHGSKIRLINGESGSYGDCNEGVCETAGSGGGGSAVLFLPPGEENWKILAVAGGGGGAHAAVFDFLGSESCYSVHNGQGGRNDVITGAGGDGSGVFDGTIYEPGAGGINGVGGGEGAEPFGSARAAGGGGAYGMGEDDDGTSGGGAGYPAGALGGVGVGPEGGYGFGGGGSGSGSGGGGGGYSGGGAGGDYNSGGGGGSYIPAEFRNNDYSATAGGHSVGGRGNGEISYQFYCVPVITGYELVQGLCTENDLGRIQLTYGTSSCDECHGSLNYGLSPLNGWQNLGEGLFRSIRPGDYTLTAETTNFSGSNNFIVTHDFTVGTNEGVPTANCRGATITLNDGTYTNPNLFNLINNGSSGPCDLTFSTSTTSFDCTNLGAHVVSLTVTGSNGESDNCTATFTVLPDPETGIPSAVCRDNRAFSLDGDDVLVLTGDDLVNDVLSTFGDCYQSMTVSPNTFDCTDIGVQMVTLTINAGLNNTSSCTKPVTINEDSGAPTALCQMLPPINLDANLMASIDYFNVDNGSYANNCTNLTYSLSQSNFGCDDIGPQTVTLTVTDGNGVSSACTAETVIENNNAPTAICKDITVALDENGSYDLDPLELNNGSSGNCGIAFVASESSFDCEDVGTTFEVTLTVTSPPNAQNTCTANVTVVDDTPPFNPNCFAAFGETLLFTNSSLNINAWRAQYDSWAEDNCSSGAGISTNYAYPPNGIFTCDDLGEQEIVIEHTDENNNIGYCSFTVFLVDTRAPNAYCMDTIVVLGLDGTVTFTPDDLHGSILSESDNCGIMNASLSQSTFDCEDIGTNTTTLTLTDHSDNQSTCDATVTVVPNPLAPCELRVDLRMMLEGPYDANSGLMNDHLRSLDLIPELEPYGGGGETVTNTVLAVAGNNAVVDWVQVELRNVVDNTEVLYMRSALVQRDGDVVDVDGISPVIFSSAVPGNYFVAIRHRNHFGVMSASSIALSSTVTGFDFTDPSTTTYSNGGDAQINVNGVMIFISGDANSDGEINASDNNNAWILQNGQAYDYGTSTADFNLDGTVNAVDKNSILLINNSKVEQLPDN